MLELGLILNITAGVALGKILGDAALEATRREKKAKVPSHESGD